MDILHCLEADHRHLRGLLSNIADALRAYVRARPAAVRRLRALVDAYIDYARDVHAPRERCLADFLRGASAPALSAHATGMTPRWQDIRARLAASLSGDERLVLRRRLAVAIRESEQTMAREERQLFTVSRDRLTPLERHALLLRAGVYRVAGAASARSPSIARSNS